MKLGRMKTIVLPIALLLAGACAPASPGRPVTPAPPGPVDALRSLWGDYSARCPDGYAFCKGDGDSICCPGGQRCCEDAEGPYCCSASRADRGRGHGGDRYSSAPGDSACWTNEITCSHAGRTICCASSDGCCADASGPYCCSQNRGY